MAGIKHISEIYKKHGEAGLRDILTRDVRITEKFDAYRFSFEKHNKNYKLVFYGKNGKTAINKIDRTLSDLYESAIEYVENLPYEIRKDLPLRHRFGFSWFPTNSPLHTEYERRPKNGLILTDITIRDNKNDVTRDVNETEVYRRYAKILNVEYAEPIHAGPLDESLIQTLISIAKNEEEPQMLTESFDTKGYLNQLHPNIEAMIFESDDQLFKIAHNEEVIKSEKRSHMFDLLLMDILEHVETFNISKIRVASTKIDEAYIEAVSEIFNDYVEKCGKNYLDSEMQKPNFLAKTGELNEKWIKNPVTRLILEKDSRYEYLFSVFLANFRRPKFASGLLNESTVNRFNSKIEELDKAIGDDYSFLEFSTILKEDNIATSYVKPEPDYVKSVHLLTRCFDPDRKGITGKIPVNVIVTNGALLTTRILDEAERLFAANKTKCILVHCNDLHNKSYGVNPENVEKVLAPFIINHEDLFVGYKIVDKLMFAQIMNAIRPKYEPITLQVDYNTTSLQKECEGTLAVNPSTGKPLKIGSIKDIQRKGLTDSLENDTYKNFCALTPPFMWPFWNEIKSAFDKYTYH
jgi:hypothetical protein